MRWIFFLLLAANIGLFAWLGISAGNESSATAKHQAREQAGAPIKLVREAPRGTLRVVPAEPASKSSENQLCTLLGPFAEAFQGEDVVQRLRALQIDAVLREIEMTGQMRYWVFLPPLDSRREAFRKLRELQAAGVDSYVIPKGSLADGISFGIFSELERAESLAGELREKGFPAQTKEEPQSYLELWVVLPPGGGELLAEDFWEPLQLEYPELDRRQNLCGEVRGN
jgi:cell division septation protein DedD